MPRQKKLPALVHHKPSSHARVRIQGRDFYLGPFGTTEAEEAYRKLLAQWLATGELPARPGSSGANPGEQCGPAANANRAVNHLILRYWRYVKGYYQKDGQQTDHVYMIRGVLRLLREHYGSTPVSSFGPLELKSLRAVLVQKGLTRSGVNRRIDAIRQAFHWGVEEDLVPPVVHQKFAAVQRLKKGRSEAPDPPPIGPVPTDDLEKTLPQLGPVVRDMVALQLLSGARPGEFCSLRPVDLDQTDEVWEYRPESHKNEHHGKARVVCFGRQGQEILAKYIEGRTSDSYCILPNPSDE